MSVNFSTIQPMSQATISKAPAYSKTAQQPVASSPMDASYQAPKKKSRWFLKTLIAAAVVLGGAALLRGKVGVFKDFDAVKDKFGTDAKILDKAKYYGKKAVAAVGDFTTEYWNKGVNWVRNLFTKKPSTPSTPAA